MSARQAINDGAPLGAVTCLKTFVNSLSRFGAIFIFLDAAQVRDRK